MDDVSKEIWDEVARMLQDSEMCKKCGREGDKDSFLCMNCKLWYCVNCESEKEFHCKTCYHRSSFRIVKE